MNNKNQKVTPLISSNKIQQITYFYRYIVFDLIYSQTDKYIFSPTKYTILVYPSLVLPFSYDLTFSLLDSRGETTLLSKFSVTQFFFWTIIVYSLRYTFVHNSPNTHVDKVFSLCIC